MVAGNAAAASKKACSGLAKPSCAVRSDEHQMPFLQDPWLQDLLEVVLKLRQGYRVQYLLSCLLTELLDFGTRYGVGLAVSACWHLRGPFPLAHNLKESEGPNGVYKHKESEGPLETWRHSRFGL